MEGSYAQYRIRVSAMISNRNNDLLVVQHRRSGRTFWSFPGGSPHLGETLLDALVREVGEETGYTVQHGGLLAIAELGANRWESPRIEVIFKGTVNDADLPSPRMDDARLEAQWKSAASLEGAFLPAGVLAAAIGGEHGIYLGNITETLGDAGHED